MVIRRQLEVHAPDDISVGDGEVAFFKFEAYSMLLQRGVVEGLDKGTAIV